MYRTCVYLTSALVGLSLPIWAEPSPTLSLSTAIQQALQGSPAIASAQAAITAAEGAERQAGAFANPELGIEAENLAGNGDYRGTDAAEYTYSLAQKLELGGKRTSRRNVASAEREATTKIATATRLNIIHDVTTAYGEVLANQQKQTLAEARENLAREVLANVSQRVGAARDPLIYKNQADVALATATLNSQNARRQLQLAKRKLAVTWGESTLPEHLDATVLTSPTAPQPLDVYQAKLTENPDLQRYADLRTAREAAFRLEKAQNTPDPSFSIGLRDFRETGHQAMVAGISMPIPVLNRNQGNVTRAGAEIAQTEHDAKQARQQAEQTLHEAWLDWQSAHAEASELQTRIIPSAQEALKLSRQGYERGRFSFLEILNAQRTLAETQEQHVTALQRQLNAKATVERLTASAAIPTGDQ